MSNGPFAYSNNGLSFRAVDPTYQAQAGEVVFADYATPAQLAAAFPGYQAAAAAQQVPAQLAAKLAAGLAVTSTATSALNATYALDPVTLDQIGSVARDSAAGLGLPGGVATFTYPDITSAPHSFTAAQIQSLYKAMRDYVSAASQTAATLQAGSQATFPAATATIP